jgi:hypothetical protein
VHHRLTVVDWHDASRGHRATGFETSAVVELLILTDHVFDSWKPARKPRTATVSWRTRATSSSSVSSARKLA